MDLKFIRWSALRGLGQSRAAGFSVFVPLIGWAILLNGKAVEYLTVATELFHGNSQLERSNVDLSAMSHIFTLSNLYFLYFGLTLVGIASFLFRAFCPRTVKDYSTPSRYVENEERFITDASINLLTEKTALAYLKQEKLSGNGISPLSTSYELQIQMNAVVHQMYISGDLGAGVASEHFVTPMDTPIIENILEEVSVNRRVSRALVESFRAEARSKRADFMIMEYFADDVTFWLLRIAIFMLYFCGFALLSIPTLRTLLKIAFLAF